MTCAGYLIVGNSHPAYVEICTGLLVCSLDVESCMETSLPSLEPRRMTKMEVYSTRASCQKMEGIFKQPDDEQEPQNETIKSQRLLQLSGFSIEVLDRDEELDEPSLPYSFQVNTYKMHLKQDGNLSSTLSDSLILSATDESAKKLWVKNIKFWNRYGWRDIVQVAATRNDLEKLQEVVRKHGTLISSKTSSCRSSDEAFCRECNSAKMMYGGRSSNCTQSSFNTRRQTKRRFYRSSIPDLFAPPS